MHAFSQHRRVESYSKFIVLAHKHASILKTLTKSVGIVREMEQRIVEFFFVVEFRATGSVSEDTYTYTDIILPHL